jgi:two-component sensor histidine kinase
MAEIRTPFAEPLLLVEEITHRVVNEYTVAIASISLEASQIADVDARAALQRVVEKLAAFAQAHRALQSPAASDDLRLGDYLERLCAALSVASLSDCGVHLILLEDEITLAPERCWRVGLIIAELITNAVKHGLKGRGGLVVVELRRVGTEVHCHVADNGGSTPNPPASRGRRVVDDIDWRFGPDGVTARLAFPLSLNPVEI